MRQDRRDGTDRRDETRGGGRRFSDIVALHQRNAERICELLSFPTTLHETPAESRAREEAYTLAECNRFLMSIVGEAS